MYSEFEDREDPGVELTDEECLRERDERQGLNRSYGNPLRLRETAKELQVLSPDDPEAIRVERKLSVRMRERIEALAEAENITAEDLNQMIY